ncbi:MAG: C40 family peptidase [Sporolactobacillus sp.]
MLTEAVISTPVATLWRMPDAVRPVDAAALLPQADMAAWLSSMSCADTIALCSEKRTETQALFGERILIIEEKNGWANVRIPAQPSSKDKDGYPGWMPSCQLTVGKLPLTERISVTNKLADLRLKTGRTLRLSYGTLLPLLHESPDTFVVNTPLGEGQINRSDACLYDRRAPLSGRDILRQATRFLHLPYLWAGMSAWGYDCSGFSYNMLRACGYTIPRDAADQAKSGTEIDKAAMQPGDLLFFAYDKGSGEIHHVGICAGHGAMLHSPTPGKKVSLTTLSGTTLEAELCTVRRFWQSGNP